MKEVDQSRGLRTRRLLTYGSVSVAILAMASIADGLRGAEKSEKTDKPVVAMVATVEAKAAANPLGQPLPPADAARAMTMPEGFKVTLFAGEPDVAQPIAFTTDDRGRLWVAECFSYPNWAATGKDQLLLFNDKDNSGHFSDRQVVLDKANNLTGVEFGFGGAWLCQAPQLNFVPMTVGADAPKTQGAAQPVLEGWSTQGKHNIVNCLVWGPDGWLYGLNGVSSFSAVGLPGGKAADRQGISCGVWRYHPTKKRFEVVACGTTNPWGLDYDDCGEMFITNCVLAHLWHIVPGAHYKRMHGIDEMQYSFELLDATSDHLHWGGGDWTTSRGGQGVHSEAGGGHSHAGAMVYLGDNWPDKYRDTMFMCNIHGNRVNNDLLERSGSDYVGKHGKDFLFANDVWFRGLNLKYGPDGGVMMSDWCDNGECHNYAVTDRSSGRMYKIVYGKPNPVPTDLDLTKLSDGELVKLQLHKNDWYVRHARRILQERAAAGHDMAAARDELKKMFDAEASVPRKLRALWALHVIEATPPEYLVPLLRHASDNVRVWAIRFLVEDKNPAEAAREEFARLAKEDPSPFVRLNLASSLQRIPPAERWPIATALVGHAEDASDKNLPLMMWYGVEGAVAADPARGLALALDCKIPTVRRYIARRVTIGEPGQNPTVGTSFVTKAIVRTDDPAVQLDLLRGMHDALRGRRQEKKPDGWVELYAKISTHPSAAIQAEAYGLAVIFGDTGALDSLKTVAGDSRADLNKRLQAIDVLVEARSDIAPLLQKLLDEPAVRSRALQGLGAYDDPRTPNLILAKFAELTPAEKRDAIGTLVARPLFARALLSALENGKVAVADVSISHARQIKQFANKQLDDRLAKVWGTLRDSPADKKEQIDHFKTLLTADSIKAGDASAGRLIFTKTCAQCHSLFGEGGKIGPDLTGANRANVDYVVQKVVDPSTAVPNDYRMKTAYLKDGRLISGIVKEQSPKAIVLQTETQRITISTDDIDDLKPSNLSLMPERQLDKMNPAEIRNLFAYLATKTQTLLPTDKPKTNPSQSESPKRETPKTDATPTSATPDSATPNNATPDSATSTGAPSPGAPKATASRLRLDWRDDWLTIRGWHLPGGEVRVHYLEAVCKPGSTDRDWAQTVIPQQTKLVSAEADGLALELRSLLSDGVILTHRITVRRPDDATDEIDFQVTAKNPTDKVSDAQWAQPCVRVDKFTGRGQDDYLSSCFVYIGGKLTRLPTEPWATKARYTPGQVYAAAGVDRGDVNPRPLSKLVPTCGLIGCYSASEKQILATAWEPYQELFQGVGVCVHSDFRIGGLKPAESKNIRGKIYITSAGPEALLKRYKQDFPEPRPSK